MKVELYTTVFNEEYLLPYTVQFYRKRIPEIIIKIYDNGSVDNTIQIAKDLNCEVYYRDTNNEIRDDLLRDWKNNIWKGSQADWVIVCDCDEWLDFKINDSNCNIIKSIGYDMVSLNKESPDRIEYGVKNWLEDKICVFKPNEIIEMNYDVGAHFCNPQGNLRWGKEVNLYHMKYLSQEFLINRYKNNVIRLSSLNDRNDWGHHYKWDEKKITELYEQALLNSIKII